MASDPEFSEPEQRVVELLAHARADTRAPDSLRVRLDRLRQPKARSTDRLLGLRAAMGTAGAGMVAVVAVIGFAGGSAAPALAQVAALSGRGPAGPAPGADVSVPGALLTAQVGGLHFPNWQAQGGWRASGERVDTLSGRRVVTVYYTRGGRRLAYSIVASPVLSYSRTSGEAYVALKQRSRVSVAWTDQGHTCVLSGSGISARSLWSLASTTLE